MLANHYITCTQGLAPWTISAYYHPITAAGNRCEGIMANILDILKIFSWISWKISLILGITPLYSWMRRKFRLRPVISSIHSGISRQFKLRLVKSSIYSGILWKFRLALKIPTKLANISLKYIY
jgi:hypothetical protein